MTKDQCCSYKGCGIRPEKLISGMCRRHYFMVRGEKLPPCCFDGCENKQFCKELCRTHYNQKNKGRDLTPIFKKEIFLNCRVKECDRPVETRGYCRPHYRAVLKGRDPETYNVNSQAVGECQINDCEEPNSKRGWCKSHYNSWRYHGDPLTAKRKEEWYSPRIDKRGYRNVYVPNHPYARANGWLAEHRVVMEELLGRYLTQEENIHHKNGVKDDNRTDGPLKTDPETGRLYSGNLELWSTSQPAGQRPGDKFKWASELILLYGKFFLEEARILRDGLNKLLEEEEDV